AEEVTVAVVAAEYVLVTPGVKPPNDALAPSVSPSVAGTAPETPPVVCVYGSTPSAPRPWRIPVARVARSAMFSRPKPHSCVLPVDTPTALVDPLTRNDALESAKAGKAAGDSEDE